MDVDTQVMVRDIIHHRLRSLAARPRSPSIAMTPLSGSPVCPSSTKSRLVVALQGLVARHDLLRSSFDEEGGRVVQCVHEVIDTEVHTVRHSRRAQPDGGRCRRTFGARICAAMRSQ
jgi:hypothetical protein